MLLEKREIQVDVVLERTSAADGVRLRRGDLFHRQHRYALRKHQRIDPWERVLEERHLDAIDERGEFVGIVDEWRDRRVREHGAQARQERTLDFRIAEQVEVDGDAVTDLERERSAAGKIET